VGSEPQPADSGSPFIFQRDASDWPYKLKIILLLGVTEKYRLRSVNLPDRAQFRTSENKNCKGRRKSALYFFGFTLPS
jgi:hypothetical protein